MEAKPLIFALALAILPICSAHEASAAAMTPEVAIVQERVHSILDGFVTAADLRKFAGTPFKDVSAAVCSGLDRSTLRAAAAAGSFDNIDIGQFDAGTGDTTIIAGKSLDWTSIIELRIGIDRGGTCSATAFPSGI